MVAGEEGAGRFVNELSGAFKNESTDECHVRGGHLGNFPSQLGYRSRTSRTASLSISVRWHSVISQKLRAQHSENETVLFVEIFWYCDQGSRGYERIRDTETKVAVEVNLAPTAASSAPMPDTLSIAAE